ncbi:AYT1-like protein [Saccharomyces kudriavzevii IFO 1802]|uniref:AYT1-like protein n=2 Tax=Saccharomyces kudriavzevii (strain ATCC MYA-4449 / AS 2.2408 / CBS 8840 / NBRC 1802 / NCYC 2889) TaxID=226230 RepID=J5P9R1_SACK1|nr:AYT1-like protein [Saccharomyces kudriavzevii IFO 1802]
MLENNRLDILGQQPSLHKLYTQICLIYRVTDPSTHDHIVNTLTEGLEILAKNFPWLAGSVINEGMGKGITGTYRIISSDKIPLVIQDLQHNPSAPTMDSLEKVNFPIRMLDEKVFAPCMTINPPGSAIGLVAETGPVFAVQVNFICGGLVLTIVGQHNTMDMTGLVSSINLLDKACHREPFSDEDLFIGNMDKSESIPLFDETWKHSSALGHEIVQTSKNTSVSTKVPPSPSKSSWGHVEFSAISLQNLKALAAQTVSPYSSFVSTDDIVTAFIWKLISRARLSRMEPETRSTLGRAVDVRKRLGLPMTYPGLLVNMTYTTYSLESIDQEPLARLHHSFAGS